MRLDLYLLANKHVSTRSQATDLIKRGFVFVDEQLILKPGFNIEDQKIKITEKKTFVSRGGEKLYQALLDFKIDVRGKIAIDIGASTGGFSHCLLSSGIDLVYAYDVGRDQMSNELKKDKRLLSYESTNILDVELPNADYIFIDVSFTSVKPILAHTFKHQADVVALIKPQFEIGKTRIKQGVVKDQREIKKILDDIEIYTKTLNYKILGLKEAIISGKEGNKEYFIYLTKKTLQ